MTVDEFWNIVERVHTFAPRDMQAKCCRLEEELSRLPLGEVLSFERHFGDCYSRANKWDIWGAAYLIQRGCSDDSFMDFRSTLISLGRKPFEAALADADSLADFDIDPRWACYEGYQYVASKVYRDHYGYEPPEETERSKYPHGPTGESFDEEEMTPRFPRLVAKYKHEDTNPEVVRKKRERKTGFEKASEHVRKIILNGIISKSGLVPPPRIVIKVIARGEAPDASGLTYRWEPFELDEGNFWVALHRLEHLSPEDLKLRPDLQGRRITLDTDCVSADDYDSWLRSLKERGLE